MSTVELTAPEHRRVIGRPFQPGQSGNPLGRPKGARNKLAGHVLDDVAAHWATHGLAIMDKAAKDDPTGYLRFVGALLPKDILVTSLNMSVGNVDPVAFRQTFRDVIAALGNEPDGEIIDVEAIRDGS
jgi:hypothetical protein